MQLTNFIPGPLLLNKLNSEPCSRNEFYKYLLVLFKQSSISLPVRHLQNNAHKYRIMGLKFTFKYTSMLTGERNYCVQRVTRPVPDGTVRTIVFGGWHDQFLMALLELLCSEGDTSSSWWHCVQRVTQQFLMALLELLHSEGNTNSIWWQCVITTVFRG
jgi:hypothetical protein